MWRGAVCVLLLTSSCLERGVIRNTDADPSCSADIECPRKACVRHRCSCDEDADCPRGSCRSGACTAR